MALESFFDCPGGFAKAAEMRLRLKFGFSTLHVNGCFTSARVFQLSASASNNPIGAAAFIPAHVPLLFTDYFSGRRHRTPWLQYNRL